MFSNAKPRARSGRMMSSWGGGGRQGVDHHLLAELSERVILPVVVSLHALESSEDRLEPSISVSHQGAKAPNQGEVASGIAIEQIVGFVEQEHDPHVRIVGQTGRDAVGHLFNQSNVPC